MELQRLNLKQINLVVRLINGVEISAFWRNMAIHIVGLGIDINNDKLLTGLVHNQELRKNRAEKIAFEVYGVQELKTH